MPFFTPMSRIEEHIQEQTAELVSALAAVQAEVASTDTDILDAISTLTAAVSALGAILTASQAVQAATNTKLDTIITKLAGGLPSVLNSDRLRVTGLL